MRRVSIGRGAFYDPWIFVRTRHHLDTGTAPRALIRGTGADHVPTSRPDGGGLRRELGCVMFRKVAPWYSKRFGPASGFNKRVVHLRSRTEFDELLAEYQRWRARRSAMSGELLPPLSAHPDGSQPPAVRLEESRPASGEPRFPIPRGPVEVW